jgi:hypothetical protein
MKFFYVGSDLFHADGRTWQNQSLRFAVLETGVSHIPVNTAWNTPFNHVNNVNVDFFELYKMTPLAPVKTGFKK